MHRLLLVVVLVSLGAVTALEQSATDSTLKAGARVFVNPMPDEFDSFLKSAIAKKKVPLTIVDSKENADFEITGSSETQKASTAKKLIRFSFRSDEQASISIADLKSGEVVFAYSVHKKDSAHGKRSTAEACAKHIKESIEKRD